MNSNRCGFSGDADTYGLGVRLGAYIQWFTSVLAYNLSDQEAASMRGVNTCFQIAMFTGLVVITTTRGAELFAVEAYIVLLFCIGGFCAASTFPWRPKNEKMLGGLGRFGPSNTGALVRIALGSATSAYGVWYTFSGLDGMLHPVCSDSAFLFANVNLYGWARTFLRVVFVTALLFTAILVFSSSFAVISGLYEWFVHWTDVEDEDSIMESPNRQISWTTVLVSMVGLALLIVAVELTLYWNHISDVYSCGSTGQLFPLVLGIAGLLRLIWKVSSDFLKGDAQF